MMNGARQEGRWWSIFRHPKMLLMVFAGPCIVYLGARNLETTLFERSPTHIQTDRFAEDYRGQRWLHVEGRLLPKYADVRPSNNGFVNVHVPLVPADWKPDQTVHVVRSFSLPASELAAWRERTLRSPRYSLTGLVGPLGPMRYWDMFATLKFEEPVVYINDGQTPDSPYLSLFLLAFGGFLLIAGWRWLLRILFFAGAGLTGMSDWFSSKAACPVSPKVQAWLEGRAAWIAREFDIERFRNTPLVLPNDDFFPAEYHAEESAAQGENRGNLDHFSLGFWAATDGRFDEAVRELSLSIEDDPGDAEAYQQRAQAYLGLGRVEEALADAERAIAIAPDDVASHGIRGKALVLSGHFDAAVADLDVVIAESDRHGSEGEQLAEAYFQRGLIRALEKDLSAAIRDFSRSIVTAPYHPEVYEARAAAYESLGKTKKAQRDREEAGYHESKPPS